MAEDLTDEAFRAAVKAWVEAGNTNRQALAQQFGVGVSTVDRWWLGTANPHPRVRKVILEWIQGQTNSLR